MVLAFIIVGDSNFGKCGPSRYLWCMSETPTLSASELAAEFEDVLLLDARVGAAGAEAYTATHLRGAHHAELERDLTGPTEASGRGGRHPLPAIESWCARLGSWGVTAESRVVIYDDQGGGMAAARAWWMLRAVGHRSVRVLDGGIQAAIEAGVPTETGVVGLVASTPYRASRWEMPLADADEVDDARRSKERRVLDARAPERYRGEVEPLDPVAGHIPGALSCFWKGALDEGQFFRPTDALEAELRDLLGGVPPERAIVYCGSGVTACHLLLRLERCGLHGASLYAGSWSEWCLSGRPRSGA